MRPILADAVDLARRALVELEPSGVGAHLGVTPEDESAATHRFEATLPGYRGWQWAVVVAAPPGADRATVSESALLPGPDALVAPEFVPWEQRVRPGDLAPGDLLAPPADDPRLVPGYVATGDPVVDEVAYQVGLGRTKVMSREGRQEAAERWYAEYGPDSEMAKAAPATCGSCGFYLPLAGSLRAAFGVCGNAMGADGHVVHVAYGCGAHSDTEVPTGGGSPLHEAYDDAAIEVISLGTGGKRADARDSAGSSTSTGPDRSPIEAVDTPATVEKSETAEVRVDAVAAEDVVGAEGAAAPDVAAAENAGIAEGGGVAGAEDAVIAPDVAAAEGTGIAEGGVEGAAATSDVAGAGIAEDSAVAENAAVAEDAAIVRNVAAVEDRGIAEGGAVTENAAVAQDASIARDVAAVENGGIAEGGAVTGDVAGVEDAAVAPEVAAAEDSGSIEDAALIGTAAVEGDVATENTGEVPNATDAAQHAGGADTSAAEVDGPGRAIDAVPTAEVGELDSAAVVTASSDTAAVRETPPAGSLAEPKSVEKMAAEAGSVGSAQSAPSVAEDEAHTVPERDTADAPEVSAASDSAQSEAEADSIHAAGQTQGTPAVGAAEPGAQSKSAEPAAAVSDSSVSHPAESPAAASDVTGANANEAQDPTLPGPGDGEPDPEARPEFQSSPRN